MSLVSYINSDAGGMGVARPYGFEIDFVRNPLSGPTAWFFVIILKLIFTPIFAIMRAEINPYRKRGSYVCFFAKTFFRFKRYSC